MSRTVTQIDIATDTFATLVNKTNDLTVALSTEILTASNTTVGANTSGNTNVLGTVHANTIGTELIKGGTSGNTATYRTLAVGFANSTVSSNVTINGYTANVSSNNLNITSNTTITTGTVAVNSVSTITGNTLLKANSSVSTISVFANTTGHYINAVATDAVINAVSTTLYSNTTIVVGDTALRGYNTSNTLVLQSNSTASNLTVNTSSITIESNLSLTGTLHQITGNVNFAANTLFIDSVAGHAAFGHNTPTFPVHVKESNTTNSLASFENSAYNAQIEVTASSGDGNGNTSIIKSGNNNHFKLVSEHGDGGYIFIAANGNIGVQNSAPTYQLHVTGQAYISSNTTIDGSIDVEGEAIFANSITFSDRVSLVSNTSNVIHTDTVTGTLVDTFDVATYQSAKYTITAQDNTTANNILMTEINAVYGNQLVYTTEYGTVYTTGSEFVQFSANANTTHVRLYATASALATANNINYKLVRTTTK